MKHVYGPGGAVGVTRGVPEPPVMLEQRRALGSGGDDTVWLLLWSDRSVSWRGVGEVIPAVGSKKT